MISVAIAVSFKPTKTQEDVPETQSLPLGGAECNTQPCRGMGKVIPGVATMDKAVITTIAAAVTTVTAEGLSEKLFQMLRYY